jgi:hypothetical protein
MRTVTIKHCFFPCQVIASAKMAREENSFSISLIHSVAAVEQSTIDEKIQEGEVELNIGGTKFHASVPTLRRLPSTFFSAFFSGRYAQDIRNDGSIFIDRDGEHFSTCVTAS